VKQALKRVLITVAPRWTGVLLAARGRRYVHRMLRARGERQLNARLVANLGTAVLAGPFAGLRLGPAAMHEHLGPFLLGTYESELDAAWDVILGRDYVQVLDVGASFGYYAAGLARRYPATPVDAFDIDPWARRALREIAGLNGLANLRPRGRCDAAWLARHLAAGALIVSDCEGYEAELFGDAVPALAAATLLIETHERAAPGVTAALERRFAPTHEIRVFATDMPRRACTHNLAFLDPGERDYVQRELRGEPQRWLFCLPRSGVAP
jgi:hypothetical protein